MTRKDAEQWAEDTGVELIFYDGMDDAIVGIGQRFNAYFLVYDVDKVIEGFMTRDGMDYEGAVEFYHFNVVAGWVGDETPCFLTRSTDGE